MTKNRNRRIIIASIATVLWLVYMVVGLALINYIYPTVRGEGPGTAAFIGLIWSSSRLRHVGSPGLTGPSELREMQLGVRRAVVDDAPLLFDLISAIDLHDFGDVDMTVEEVRDDLAGADLANDSWLVYRPEAEGAALVAFAAVEPRADEEFRGRSRSIPNGGAAASVPRLPASSSKRSANA